MIQKEKDITLCKSMDAQDNFLESAKATKQNVNEISKDIGQEAKLRIIKFFNFKLTPEEIQKIPIILEDYTVYEMVLKPVRFLFYIDEKYLKKTKKMQNKNLF